MSTYNVKAEVTLPWIEVTASRATMRSYHGLEDKVEWKLEGMSNEELGELVRTAMNVGNVRVESHFEASE